MKKRFVVVLLMVVGLTAVASVLILLSGCSAGTRTTNQASSDTPQAVLSQQAEQRCTAWLVESLKRMQTIKVAMTHADLLKVFTTEGGLSTGIRRTYVYRECPFIKVDVEFEPVGRPARDIDGRVTLVEADEDVIKSISKPYLEWSVMN